MTLATIKVSIVHQDPFARACIAAALQAGPGLDVFVDPRDGTACDADYAESVIVADYANGVRIAQQASRGRLSPRGVVVLADSDREWELRSALALQVRGYLTPGFAFDQLVESVHVVSRGARYLCARAAARLAESFSFEALTDREGEVMALVVEGLCNKSIGKALNISNGTVKSHLKSTYSKLDVISRTQAIAAAQRRGILERRRDAASTPATAALSVVSTPALEPVRPRTHSPESSHKESTMFKIHFIAGALFATFAGAASAQASAPAGETHAQVKAETAEAIRDGDIIVNDEGKKANEVNPSRYPKKPTSPGLTRSEVKTELAQARKNGDLPMGDLDETAREENPGRYPAQPTAPGLTRAQVKAETQAAIRAGDIQVGDSDETLADKDPARYKGAPAKPPKFSLHRHPKTAPAAASTPAN